MVLVEFLKLFLQLIYVLNYPSQCVRRKARFHLVDRREILFRSQISGQIHPNQTLNFRFPLFINLLLAFLSPLMVEFWGHQEFGRMKVKRSLPVKLLLFWKYIKMNTLFTQMWYDKFSQFLQITLTSLTLKIALMLFSLVIKI